MKSDISEYFKELCCLLSKNDWEEPTKEIYPTYGKSKKAPYYEDIHYCWRQYSPSAIINTP